MWCGVQREASGDRIALWVKDRGDVEKVNRIGKKLISLLELEKEPGILMEFSAHSDRADEAKLEGVYSVQNPMQASLGSAKLTRSQQSFARR